MSHMGLPSDSCTLQPSEVESKDSNASQILLMPFYYQEELVASHTLQKKDL
jgi:hypothetical protein